MKGRAATLQLRLDPKSQLVTQLRKKGTGVKKRKRRKRMRKKRSKEE